MFTNVHLSPFLRTQHIYIIINIIIYIIYIYIYISMGPLGKPEADDVNNFANRSLVPAKTSEMVIHYKDSKGVDRIKGGRDMKASQAYPKMCSGQIVF